jgi:hypothetical protein
LLDKNKQVENPLLSSSFHIIGKLNGTFLELKKKLEETGVIKNFYYGNELKFYIENDEDHKQILELSKNYITFTFYCGSINIEEKMINLGKFLSILAFLDRYYEIKLASLYPYLMELLGSNIKIAYLGQLDEQRVNLLTELSENLNRTNANLSSHIIKLIKSKNEVDGELQLYRAFSFQMVKTLSAHRGDLKTVLVKDFRVDINLADAVVGFWIDNCKSDKNAIKV